MASLPGDRFPNLVALAGEFAKTDLDERFELLIAIFIVGLAEWAGQPRPASAHLRTATVTVHARQTEPRRDLGLSGLRATRCGWISATRVYGSGARAVTALDGVISAFASWGVHSRDGPVGTGKPALLQVAAGIGWSPPARFASAASSSAVALPLRLNGRRLKPKAVR